MKNTIAAMTLAITVLFGATFANAGIILTDRTDQAAGIILTDRTNQAAGIILTDLTNTGCNSTPIATGIFGRFASLMGIILTDLTGRNEGCGGGSVTRRSTIVTDRAAGIILTD